MSKVGDDAGTPRAIVHKRILDVAESNPDATIEGIADEISAATPDLVDRVLAEYGDPCEQQPDETVMTQNGQTPDRSGSDHPTLTDSDQDESADEQTDEQPTADQQVSPAEVESELTTKQRETARLVHETPDASQGEIADRLGVTRATVSRRLNDIPGFEWQDRRAFTEALFDAPAGGTEDREEHDETAANESPTGEKPTDEQEPDSEEPGDQRESTSEAVLDRFDERLDAVETRLAEAERDRQNGDNAAGDEQVTLPPELAHKVVHAAMESDRISEDEELQLLKALLE